MINLLIGTIYTASKNPITCLVGGVGYAVYVPEVLRSVLKKDETIILSIYTSIKEDAFDLYGFIHESDVTLFKHLISVSGIGPKTALAIMDKGSDKIIHAISTGSVQFFTGIPRLGNKNAQKIIIELKSKLINFDSSDAAILSDLSDSDGIIDALIGMGFLRKDIRIYMQKIPAELQSTEDKIRFLIKHLGKHISQ